MNQIFFGGDILKPLFIFKNGREKPFPMAEFVKKIAKNDMKWRNDARLSVFNLSRHLSEVKMLVKSIHVEYG